MAKHVVPHDLSPELATKVVERAFETYSARFPDYKPTMRWASDSRAELSFVAKGLTVRGAMDLVPNGVAVDLDVPFLLRPFKNKTIEIVEREIRQWVAKAKAGEI